jgi:hypothetical protein
MIEEKIQDNSPPLTAFNIGMMGVVALLRLVPLLLHVPSWNTAPVQSLCVFGGARFGFWSAFVIPLTMMAGTDFLVYALTGWKPFDPWVYGSLVVCVLIGRLLVNTKSPWLIAACTLLASAQFFLVTNFGVWLHARSDELPAGQAIKIERATDGKLMHLTYANSAEGLAMCYFMGANFAPKDGAPLGFALPMFLSNLAFSGLMFGSSFGVSRWIGRPMLKRREAAS